MRSDLTDALYEAAMHDQSKKYKTPPYKHGSSGRKYSIIYQRANSPYKPI